MRSSVAFMTGFLYGLYRDREFTSWRGTVHYYFWEQENFDDFAEEEKKAKEAKTKFLYKNK